MMNEAEDAKGNQTLRFCHCTSLQNADRFFFPLLDKFNRTAAQD
jgi:hypothetical protein